MLGTLLSLASAVAIFCIYPPTLLPTLSLLLCRTKACSIDPVEVFREVFQGSSRADINTHLEQRIAISNRFALNRHREFRLSPFFAKDEGCDRVRARRNYPHREHEPFWCCDFSVCACKRVFHFLAAVDPSKCSIWPQVDFANRERDATRIPPIRDVLRFGPGFEDHRARRIEDARQHNLVVRGSSDCERSGVLHR